MSNVEVFFTFLWCQCEPGEEGVTLFINDIAAINYSLLSLSAARSYYCRTKDNKNGYFLKNTKRN